MDYLNYARRCQDGCMAPNSAEGLEVAQTYIAVTANDGLAIDCPGLLYKSVICHLGYT